jgi:DNA-binding transcriptional regulator YiaG
MKKKYQSEILHMVHENAVANFKVGAITEERMRYYDRECLVPEGTAPQTPLHITHHPYPNAFNLESPSSYQRPG